MKYIVLNPDNSVSYTFEQTNKDNELYSADFLNSCILVTDDVNAPVGYIYNKESNVFNQAQENSKSLPVPAQGFTKPVTIEALVAQQQQVDDTLIELYEKVGG